MIIANQEFGGERPLYKSVGLRLRDVVIHEGESSVKECQDVVAEHCRFEGKYVFWENDGVVCRNCYFADSARSSVWYSKNIRLCDCVVDAPKMFRRTQFIELENVSMPHALETFWRCSHVSMKKVRISEADYLFLDADDIEIINYRHYGNYAFQHARNVVIYNAIINSKDSFWNSKDCTLYDCEINGEYLGWYAENLKLVRCRISGQQPLCYCNNLILEDCSFSDDANLAFEYSTVHAVIKGPIHSIKNPTSGSITVDAVGEVIIDKNQKMPADCKIVVKG